MTVIHEEVLPDSDGCSVHGLRFDRDGKCPIPGCQEKIKGTLLVRRAGPYFRDEKNGRC